VLTLNTAENNKEIGTMKASFTLLAAFAYCHEPDWIKGVGVLSWRITSQKVTHDKWNYRNVTV